MKLKVINTPLETTWLVHDPESNTHIGKLVYEGSQRWHFGSEDEDHLIDFEAADFESAVHELEERIHSTTVMVPADTPPEKVGELINRKVLRAVPHKEKSPPQEPAKPPEGVSLKGDPLQVNAGLTKAAVMDFIESQFVDQLELIKAADLKAEYMSRLVDVLSDFVARIDIEEGRNALIEALHNSLKAAVNIRVAQRGKRESFLEELLNKAFESKKKD